MSEVKQEGSTSEVFQESKNPASTSRWSELCEVEFSAAGAPGRRRFEAWLRASVTHVVTMQRGDEMPDWLPGACEEHGVVWEHFPLSGKRLEAPEDAGELARLFDHARGFEPGARVVVHCSAGLHRTGLALFMIGRALGLEATRALEFVSAARALTGEELVRSDREGRRLCDRAEEVIARCV